MSKTTMQTIGIILAVIFLVLIVIAGAFMFLPARDQAVNNIPTLNPLAGATQAQPVKQPLELPSATATLAAPTATLEIPTVAVIVPTVDAATVQAFTSQVSFQEELRPDGRYVTITGQDGSSYRIGPLAKGAYALGHNGLYFVYISNAGQVYALRLGNPYFVRVKNLKDDLLALIKHVEPSYRLSFSQATFYVALIVDEENFGDRQVVPLPRDITY